MNLDATNQQKWSDLLAQAVTQPGLILKAYSAFHGYSLGNQLGALLHASFTVSSQARLIHIKDGSTKAATFERAKRQSGLACLELWGQVPYGPESTCLYKKVTG